MIGRATAILMTAALLFTATSATAQWRDGGRDGARDGPRGGRDGGRGGWNGRRSEAGQAYGGRYDGLGRGRAPAGPGSYGPGGYGSVGYGSGGYGSGGYGSYGGYGRPAGDYGGAGLRRGQVAPPAYRGAYVPDPGRYHLRAAPPGYGWIGDGRNAYLTQRSTGMVLDSVPGAYEPAPAYRGGGRRRGPR